MSAGDWPRRSWRRFVALVRRRPLLTAFFALGFVVTSVPIWVTPILPQGDIYQHLAIVEVIHNYDAPGSIYPDLFELPDSIKPNLAYYYVVHWLGHVMPLHTASKLFLNLYVVLLPLSLLALLTTFQRPRRLALFGFLFIYIGLFRNGFAGYLVSMPLYFFGIAAFYRWHLAPSRRRAALNAALASLVFLAHAQMYLLYMLTVGYMALVLWRPGGFRRFVHRLLAPCVSLVLFLPWFLTYFVFWKSRDEVMGLAGPSEGFGASWHTPEVLLSRAFTYLQQYFRDTGDEWLMLGIFFLMLIGIILRGHREASPVPGESTEPDMPWTHRYMPELVSLLLALSIVVLPVHIKNQAVISTRHIPLFALSVIPWLGWFRGRRASTALAVAVMVLTVTQAGYTAKRFLDYERELDDYQGLFEDMRPWSRLWKVSGPDLFSRVAHGNVFWHLHYNFMIWHGGVTDVQFAQYVTCPVRYKDGAVPPYLPDEPHKSKSWRYYDYFLVQKSEKSRVKGLRRWLKPVGENRDWILYEKRDRPFEKWFDLERWSPPIPEKRDPEKKAPEKKDPEKTGPGKSGPGEKRPPRRGDEETGRQRPDRPPPPPHPARPTAKGRLDDAQPSRAQGNARAAMTAAEEALRKLKSLRHEPAPRAPRRLPPHLGRRSKNTLKPAPGEAKPDRGVRSPTPKRPFPRPLRLR